MPNEIRLGVQNALDRVFNTAITERISGTPEPNQLEERPTLPKKPYARDIVPQDLNEVPQVPWWQQYITNPLLYGLGGLLQGAGKATELAQKGVFEPAGAALTYPFRTSWQQFSGKYLQGKPGEMGIQTFFPGGEEYETYKKWKESGQQPSIPVPIPSWKQLGAWLKPTLSQEPYRSIFMQFGSDPKKWEEPPIYEPATMGLGEVAETAPLMFFGGGVGKKPLEKAAEIVTKKVAEGKTAEVALNEAFSQLAKKGILPKIAGEQVAKIGAEEIKPITEIPVETPTISKVLPELPKPITTTPKVELTPNQVKLDELKTKLMEGLQISKRQRPVIEAGKKEALSPKIEAFQTQLDNAKTFEEVERAYGSLKGKITPEDVNLAPFSNLTDEDKAFMIQAINNAQVFQGKPIQAGNTIRALNRAIKGEEPPLRPFEIRDISKVFGEVFGKELMQGEKLGGWKVAAKLISGIINLPKSILSSGDFGGILRQSIFVVPRYPIKATKAMGTGIKAWFASPKYSEEIEDAIRASKYAPFREKLDLTELPVSGLKGWSLTKKEEAFQSNLAHYIPVLGEITKRSERAFVTSLNKFRADIFDSYAALWEGKVIQREFDDLCEVINIGTGRGAIESNQLKAMTVALNNVLFSPRLQISRLQALGMPITALKYWHSPRVMRMVYGDIAAFIGTIGGIVMLVKYAGIPGVTVESENPTSTDYMKIKVGDTRLDPWGGFQQYIRLFSRLLTGEMKLASGEDVNIDKLDEMIRFARLKLSPALSAVVDAMIGQSVIGKKLSQDVTDRAVPMAIQDIIDASRSAGLTGAIVAAPGLVGGSITTYPSRTYADWLDYTQTQLGKEWTDEEIRTLRPDFNKAEGSWYDYLQLPTGKARQYYREANPDIEASMYFWGEVKQLSTPESIKAFKDMAKKYNLSEDTFPIRNVVEPFNPKGKTPEETFYVLVDIVPSYFADYLVKNKNSYMTKDLPMLISTFEKVDNESTKLIDKYNMDTKGMESKDRELYRLNNSDVDVALNLWGRVSTIKSKKALVDLRLKADELGIPHDLIPALSKSVATPSITVTPKSTGKKSLSEKVKELLGD